MQTKADFTGEDEMFYGLKGRYRIFFAGIFMIFNLSICGNENNSKELLTAEAKVQRLTVAKLDKSFVSVNILVTVILKNSGNVPVLLLDAYGFPHVKSGFILAEKEEKLTSQGAFVFNFYGESIDTSSKWTLLAKSLDTSKPSEKYFIFLDVGQTISLEQQIKFQLPISAKNKTPFRTESWEKINAAPEVWIQIMGDSWSLNIDRASKNLSGKLRKRWQKFGYLWTDLIISKPVKLDFKVPIEK
ncbi:MAG: hypothetical protein ACK5NT_04030 [Pyrinomonadaceae bacterium]